MRVVVAHRPDDVTVACIVACIVACECECVRVSDVNVYPFSDEHLSQCRQCLCRRKSGRNQSISQSNVVNDDNNRSIDAWSTGANARAVHGVFFFVVVLVVVVVAIERGNPAG